MDMDWMSKQSNYYIWNHWSCSTFRSKRINSSNLFHVDDCKSRWPQHRWFNSSHISNIKNFIEKKNSPYSYTILLIFFFIESSGFVYGTMSFVEKIFVGIAIMLVQKYMPNLSNNPHASVPYFKWMFVIGCGGVFIFSMIIFAILMPQKIGKRYFIFCYLE